MESLVCLMPFVPKVLCNLRESMQNISGIDGTPGSVLLPFVPKVLIEISISKRIGVLSGNSSVIVEITSSNYEPL
jgi:hypothetical protein